MPARKKSGKVKVGIIGSGGIARGAHIPGYKACPDCEVIAVCDSVEEVVKKAAQDFDIPMVFTDYKKLLAVEEIDAVSICTPNYLHAKPSIMASNAGKHVLCEKPIAMNGKEGQAMVDAAKANSTLLFVGLNLRFGAASQALKRWVDAGELGEAYYARAMALRRRGIPGWGVFGQKDKQGGGPMIDIGVHILDLTLYLMGHPKAVAASGQCYAKFGKRDDVIGLMGQWDTKTFTVEDWAAGFVRLENGATLTIESSFCANLETDVFNAVILGDKGGLQFSPTKMMTERQRMLLVIEPQSLPEARTHEAEMKAFIAAIRTGERSPLATGEEALNVQKILDAIYLSSDRGKEVIIK